MGNLATEQKATSQDKSIIQGIGFKEFSSICQEYQIVEKATKELLEIAKDDDTPVRTKVDIYRWVIEMNVGKPRQITTELDDKLTELKVNKAKEETDSLLDWVNGK